MRLLSWCLFLQMGGRPDEERKGPWASEEPSPTSAGTALTGACTDISLHHPSPPLHIASSRCKRSAAGPLEVARIDEVKIQVQELVQLNSRMSTPSG